MLSNVFDLAEPATPVAVHEDILGLVGSGHRPSELEGGRHRELQGKNLTPRGPKTFNPQITKSKAGFNCLLLESSNRPPGVFCFPGLWPLIWMAVRLSGQ